MLPRPDVCVAARLLGFGICCPEQQELAQSLAQWLGTRSVLTSAEAELLPIRARKRTSLLTRMTIAALAQASRESGVSTSDSPIVFGSAYGEIATTVTLLDSVHAGEPRLSPLRFHASIHNTAVGQVSIACGNRRPCTAIAAGSCTAAMTVLEALTMVVRHQTRVLLVLADETSPPPFTACGSSLAIALAFEPMASAVAHPCVTTARIGPMHRKVATLSWQPPGSLRSNPVAAALCVVRHFVGQRSGSVPLELMAPSENDHDLGSSAGAYEPWHVELLFES